ncbi:hypothetical protein OVN20_03955 [Microcella daejeonensis]|uniref:hypothetical protein n=1 Tax=Microcella daejeonensis TaxID=2994971 RepID=UPI00226F47D8|nr:hypothetical protein [Microcella daejeonensis]WAB84729.1 hypothetical protein OVN20_03955 [Microcella daejeonensis]
MLRRTGIIIGIVGVVCGAAGVAWYSLLPTVDANIGAGLLVVVGLAKAAVGVGILAVSLLTPTRTGRESRGSRGS